MVTVKKVSFVVFNLWDGLEGSSCAMEGTCLHLGKVGAVGVLGRKGIG